MSENNTRGKPLLHKMAEPELDHEQPWKDDVLDREQYANRLTDLLSTLSQPYVMGIDSSYGGGKTFFIRRWQASLASSGYKTVYFNAWESDFSNDPLAAFISALRNQLDKDQVGKDVANRLKNIVRIAAPALIKHTLYRYLGEDTVNSLKESGGDDILNIAQKLADSQIREQEEAEKGLDAFKKEMSDIVQKLGNEKNAPLGPKLIIFVEELDRCRPNYAAEVLERIKHFFSVPGILFVVSADRKHLGCSFSSIYGADLDQEGYMARFVDNWFRLPNPNNENFAKYLIEKFRLIEDGIVTSDGQLNTDESVLSKLFGACATYYNSPLRKQEQLFSIINIALRGVQVERGFIPTIYPIILFSMLEIPIDFENSCRTERMHGDFQKNLNAILANIDNSKTRKYYYDYVSATITRPKEQTRGSGPTHFETNDVDTIRSSLRKMFLNTDKTIAQMAYEDLKFWNAASAQGFHK